MRSSCLGAGLLGLALSTSGCGESAEVTRESGACAKLGLSDQGDVRVFVVGHKQTLADAESYATFEASYRRHVEAVEPCLSTERPNLVVFPENAALGALLVGARGEAARQSDTSIAAFVAALDAYPEVFEHYKAQYPEITLRRQLMLALTDVTWRAFERTFSGIAEDYGVWVMANADVAPAKQTSEPALVSLLGDPEAPEPGVAFVAAEPTPLNSAYLFEPGGAVSGRVDKVFLVPSEENDLDLVNGSFTALGVLETPFARIGVATSRDAFYAPFMQRLEDLDADLIVQPEAFSGWTVEQLPGDWLPDVFLSSGWLHTQRHRTFRHSLNPVYTGNFFELVFDGQSHITERARPSGQGLGYVGQDPVVGFAAIGPWVEPDPKLEEPGLSLSERRARLREKGTALLPASGSPDENGYVDSLIAADLRLPRAEAAGPIELVRDTSLPESRPVSEAAKGDQRNADLAATTKGALAVWQDGRTGSWRIRHATTADGATWTDAGELDPASVVLQRKPAVCTDGTRMAVVWQEGEAGSETIRASLAADMSATFAKPLGVSSGKGPAWDPDCGFLPDGSLMVVYTDLGSGVARLRLARLPNGGASFDAPIEVDPSTAAKPRVEGTQALPSASDSGGHLAWIDYRDHSWDVYVARFDGAAVSGIQRVDAKPDPADRERLHSDPRIEALGERVVVAWTDLRDRRGHSDVAFAWSDDGGATFSERRLVPGGPASEDARTSGGDAMARFRPAIVHASGGAELLFQDLSADKSGLFRALLGTTGKAEGPARADDTGESPTQLTRPRGAKLGAGTLVVWEDERDGAYRIYSSLL